jgi:uncharacterized protein
MVDVEDAAVAAILTRAPSAGGKRRLFRALGRTPDPALLASLLLDTLDGTRVPGVARVIAVEPAGACDEIRALVPRDVHVMPQVTGTLGDRMAAVMGDLFAGGAAAVALIGSDLPQMTPDVIAGAFAALTAQPDALVLGPAFDGGYYLIAATGVPAVFEGIDWGTDRVLEQTLAAAARRERRVELLGAMADVDTVADLRAVSGGRTAEWCRRNLEAH